MHWKLILIFVACLLLYAGLGGLAYHFIETNYENALRPVTQQNVLAYTSGHSCLNLSKFLSIQPVLASLRKGGLLLNPRSGLLVNATNWDFASGIFAASQIIGAIGYGNMAPQTTGGKVFLVFYACIGIPLFIVLSFGLSHPIVRLVRWFENRFCGSCALGDLLVKRADPPPGPQGAESPQQHWTLKIVGMYFVRIFILFVIGSIFFVIIPAAIFHSLEVWTYAESIYYAYVSVLSVGFGDYVPGNTADQSYRDWYRVCTAFYLYVSVAFFVVVFSPVKEALDYRGQINKPLDLHEPDPIRLRPLAHRHSAHQPASTATPHSEQEGERWLAADSDRTDFDHRNLHDVSRPSLYPSLPGQLQQQQQQEQVIGDVTRLSINDS